MHSKLNTKYMKRKREGMHVLSARSATTGGGNALVANCAAEPSAAILCPGRSPQGQLGNGATKCQCTGQRGANARGNEMPKNGATMCQSTRIGGPKRHAPEWRPGCKTPERWSAAGVLSTTGDLGTAGVRAILGPRKTEGALSRLGGTLGRWSTGWPTDRRLKVWTRWGA